MILSYLKLFRFFTSFLLVVQYAAAQDYYFDSQIQSEKQKCDYGYYMSKYSCLECGKSIANQNHLRLKRIVGGRPAKLHAWPAQIAIMRNSNDNEYQYYEDMVQDTKPQISCAGTLINDSTIVTAAHCVYDVSPSNLTVYAGVADISDLTFATKLSVQKIIVHKDYVKSSFFNDIALLILSEPVELNENIQPACLPNENYGEYPLPGVHSFAIGWGSFSESLLSSSDLLYIVKLEVLSPYKCIRYSSYDSTYQICAGSHFKDTCKGDSGGGLYVYDSILQKYVVVGITSYGHGCAEDEFPGVYTRISAYLDWINNNLESNFNPVNDDNDDIDDFDFLMESDATQSYA